jgi:hypothetical protein
VEHKQAAPTFPPPARTSIIRVSPSSPSTSSPFCTIIAYMLKYSINKTWMQQEKTGNCNNYIKDLNQLKLDFLKNDSLTFPYMNNFASTSAPLMTRSAVLRIGVSGSPKLDAMPLVSPSTSIDGGAFIKNDYELVNS